MNNDIFLGRQPILDRDQCTFGYELLFRDGPDRSTFFDDPDDATRAVMERTLLHWGMERIVGDRFGFINASPSLFEMGFHRAMPPEGIIFEVREEEPLTGTRIEAITAARREGYHLALDNVPNLAAVTRSTLLPYVSIVKIDVSATPPSEVASIIDVVRAVAPKAHIAAEKVQSREDFRRCMGQSFDLFQGYFFAEPEVLRRAGRPASATTALALAAAMQATDVDIDKTVELVGSDPSLAYRILAVVNSSAFGINRRVESLRHAIVLLGLNHVRHLAALLALSASDKTSEELITLGAARARLASMLVDGEELAPSAFTVGLLSVTDAIYETPISELIRDLPVSTEIAAALTSGDGPLGDALEAVRACERADLEELSKQPGASLRDLQDAYGDAIRWADQLRNQITPRRSSLRLADPARSAIPV